MQLCMYNVNSFRFSGATYRELEFCTDCRPHKQQITALRVYERKQIDCEKRIAKQNSLIQKYINFVQNIALKHLSLALQCFANCEFMIGICEKR